MNVTFPGAPAVVVTNCPAAIRGFTTAVKVVPAGSDIPIFKVTGPVQVDPNPLP